MMDDATKKRTAVLFAWLNQVKADGALIASCFKAAYELTQWTNGEAFDKDGSLIAWPSLRTIAIAIAMSERTVRDMVKRLEARGHLSIKVGHGPGHPSLYTLVMKNRQSAAAFEEIGTDSELISRISESGSPVPLSEGEIMQPAAIKAAVQRHESGGRLPANHLEPFLNHESESARATFLPNDFKLDDATLSWALDRFQNDREALDRSIRRFIDFHRQVVGEKAKSRNWQAKVRIWIDGDAERRKPDKCVHSAAARLQEKPVSSDSSLGALEQGYRMALKSYLQFGHWTRHVGTFGPAPDTPGCRIPDHLLIEFGLKKDAA
jgi:hypothetical protein